MSKENKLDRCLKPQDHQDQDRVTWQNQIINSFQSGDIEIIFKTLRGVNRELTSIDFGGNIEKTDNASPFAKGQPANTMNTEIDHLLKDFQAGRHGQLEIQLSNGKSIVIKVVDRNKMEIELADSENESD